MSESNYTGSYFMQYRRKQVAELRQVTEKDITNFKTNGFLMARTSETSIMKISISDADLAAGSPKIGDMIARNPDNHLDQWLVAEKYFRENFEAL